MSSQHKNLSDFDHSGFPDASNMRIGIVVSEWNNEITHALLKGVIDTLKSLGCPETNIIRHDVPGSFELPLAASWMIEKENPDAVICIGCVIQGETRHFDFICEAVAQGIMDLGLRTSVPVIFGVLTPENQQQAIDRAGGRYGNKGVETAQTAVKMVALRNKK